MKNQNNTGADTKLIELHEINLPLFNPNKPRELLEDIKKLNNQMVNADAFILATPEIFY